MSTTLTVTATGANDYRREIPIPPHFNIDEHRPKLLQMIANTLGDDWQLKSIDREANPPVAIVVRKDALLEFKSTGTDDHGIVKCPGAKLNDGPRIAAHVAMERPGYEIIRFSPVAGEALIAKLAPDVSRCRQAVAGVLGCNPWDMEIKVVRRGDETLRYELKLPDYVPSKHEKKLWEVAQAIVGHEGWSVKVDPMTLEAQLISGPHYGFTSKIIPLPAPSRGTANDDFLAWGERINQGRPELEGINFAATAHCLISGKTGSGKTIAIEDVIANAIAAGWQLAILEGVKRGTDFLPFRPFCAPNLWCCDSLAHAAAGVRLVEKEYDRRTALLKQHGVAKIADLPASVRPPRWLIVVDEFKALTSMGGKKGLSASDMKLLPESVQRELNQKRVAKVLANAAKSLIIEELDSLVAKSRFVGLHVLVGTQRGDVESLGSSALREQLATKVLLGVNSNSTAVINMTLNCVADEVPDIPRHLLDEDEVARKAGHKGPTWLKGAAFVNTDGEPLHISKAYFFDKERLATEDPWMSKAREGKSKGYGTALSEVEVGKLIGMPVENVRDLMGMKPEDIDGAEPDSDD